MLSEERAYLESNRHADLIRSVFRLARIDVGRADFSLVGGRVQIYGIDASLALCARSDERQRAHFPRHLVAADRMIEQLGALSRSGVAGPDAPDAADSEAGPAVP